MLLSFFTFAKDEQGSTLVFSCSLVLLYLLLPIKVYAEGPVEIRGGSEDCTRGVRRAYAEGQLFVRERSGENRSILGFCSSCVVSGGSKKRTRRVLSAVWGAGG